MHRQYRERGPEYWAARRGTVSRKAMAQETTALCFEHPTHAAQENNGQTWRSHENPGQHPKWSMRWAKPCPPPTIPAQSDAQPEVYSQSQVQSVHEHSKGPEQMKTSEHAIVPSKSERTNERTTTRCVYLPLSWSRSFIPARQS